MIDTKLVPLVEHVLTPLARLFVRGGVHADYVTIGGFFCGLAAVPAIALGSMELALMFILLNRIADGLDGTIARMTTPTRRGAFLDIAFDFVFYALVPLGFALADPASNALPAVVLLTSFVGTGSSFLAVAVLAAERRVKATAFPTKGIYYIGGLTEGFETIVVFCLMCLLPGLFPFLAYLFAVACMITTMLRWWQGWTEFSKDFDAV